MDPVDPVYICNEFDIALIKLSEITRSCGTFKLRDCTFFSAATIKCDGQISIIHNDSHHPDRQRSNICHELGHCFLGHPLDPALTTNGERIRDGGVEAEANFLAGSLLIPNEAAVHIMRCGLMSTARQLYGVSQPMLVYRLRVSGAQKIHERIRNQSR